jgi:hypothetical protein
MLVQSVANQIVFPVATSDRRAPEARKNGIDDRALLLDEG